MRVAIIGSGGIGRGYAAYLTTQGHEPVLWSPSGAAQADFVGGAELAVTGRIEASLPLAVAAGCAEALAGSDAVIVAVQANGFRAVLEAMAPHLVAAHAPHVCSNTLGKSSDRRLGVPAAPPSLAPRSA